MSTILITGCNRGIGLELTRHFSNEGHEILACCRTPETSKELQSLSEDNSNITIYRLDVSDHNAIEQLAEKLKGKAIDILLNNAGIYGKTPASFGNLDYENWEEVLRINTIAPIKMAESFIDNITAGDRKIIANISSKVGSIADNSSGGSYTYRTSKTALNMATKCLSVDLASQGITALALHPGWVKTDMGGPNALIDTNQSVSGLVKIISSADISKSGKFFNYDGSEIPW